jgi:hypothetical protein
MVSKIDLICNQYCGRHGKGKQDFRGFYDAGREGEGVAGLEVADGSASRLAAS